MAATLPSSAGTLRLVSHERAVLDNVATQTLVAEGDGRWVEYAGGYSDRLVQRAPPVVATATSARKAKAPRERPADSRVRLTFNGSPGW